MESNLSFYKPLLQEGDGKKRWKESSFLIQSPVFFTKIGKDNETALKLDFQTTWKRLS